MLAIQLACERQIEIDEAVAEGSLQVSSRNPPRFANRCRSAGQWNIRQMRNTFRIVKVSHEKFAAPELAVQTKAESVKRDTDNLAVDLVVGHATGDVRVMMLHRDLHLHVVER